MQYVDCNEDTKETEQGMKKPKKNGENIGSDMKERAERNNILTKKTQKSLTKMKRKLIIIQETMLSIIKEPKNPKQTKMNIVPRKQLYFYMTVL